MPNWCDNTLIISVADSSDEAQKQLEKFIQDVRVEPTVVNLTDAEKHRETYLSENFDSQYRNAADVFVHHSEMDVEKFMAEVLFFDYDKDKQTFEKGGSVFSMQNILPVPVELLHPDAESYGGHNSKEKDKLREELKKKFGFSSWYEWRCSNWGTKWDLSPDSLTIVDEDDDSITYSFSTAWSPPNEFLMNICKNYPLLKFHLSYEEPGAAFEGDLEIEGGEVTRDESRDWVQKNCYCCGEELDEGESFDEDGNCPDCKEDNQDDDEE